MTAEKLIRIRITPIDKGFVRATSVDIPGLYAAAKSLKVLLETEVPAALNDLLSLDGRTWEIGQPERLDDVTYLWRANVARQMKRAC